MACDICAINKDKRLISGNRICEDCFSKIQNLRKGDVKMIAHFKDPLNLVGATPRAINYIMDIIKEVDTEETGSDYNLMEATESEIASFIISSTDVLEGYRITKYLGIEYGEVVMGTGFIAEGSAAGSDFFGTSNSAFRSKLSVARQEAINRLKVYCSKKGANAIVGVDIDIMTIGDNMLVVSANGTAVVAEKICES